MILKKTFLLSFVVLAVTAQAQKDEFILLKNAFLERQFSVKNGAFFTSSFRNLLTGKDYSREGSEEFYLTLGGQAVAGAGQAASFGYAGHSLQKKEPGVQQLSVRLKGRNGSPAQMLEVELIYWLYDEFPVVRKQLRITNRGSEAVAIENLEVERLNLVPVNTQQTDIYSEYGTRLTWRPFVGNHHDAAVYVCHVFDKEGFILGNEAPSVLKRTELYTFNDRISVGTTKTDDHYPFKRWIAPGETFFSPKAFICLVKAPTGDAAFEGPFADFVRTRLGVKLFEREEIPFAFYNTWFPFRTNLSDTLLYKVADGLAGTGVDLLIIDDGWQANFGDWEADPKKFPDGLKPVCDDIVKKGMRPGLWLSLATVSENSRVFREHPEWAVLGKDGKPAYLHTNGKGKYTMSMGSGYYDYILQKIKNLVKENSLAYLKLDFAIANSAYVLDYERKGDYGGFEHKTYRDRASSYYGIYEKTMQFFDELHQAFPDLLIDCTYEVWGEYYINDFALLEHADYDWLTNYEADPPEGPVSIRQMAYDRARVIPAATNLIGNQQMYTTGANTAITKHYKYTYLSLASSKPILVGDPRSFPEEAKAWYAKWNNWFKEMDRKYQFTRFSQGFEVFPRPNLINWDGCYKFNKESEGGVLFFYRNGSPEPTRTFQMPLVNAGSTYRLYDPEDGKIFGRYTGRELLEKGITITIPNQYEAKVLGIEKINH